MFSLRIVNVDHYMSSPKSGLDLTYSQFRGCQVKSVPVFRIFGSTPSGNKTCLHIHGVFPYILVPYSGDSDAGRLMYQLASSLDKAINVSQNSSHSTRQHVFKIVQVSGRPFYGYHNQDHQFFKIFFYNPLIVKRACDLLQNGAVCGTKFQIHEGHVPFTLQFFIDYNLYGMSFINVKSVVFRKDASPPGVTSGSLMKESVCELEADAVAVDILNRLTIEGELAVNPGLAAIWREEKERLQRDALESSQRPEAPLAISEMLLREKLNNNLRFQGTCKTPLKENIPYPAETQQTTGSDLLDASVLDTHSISSLALTRPSADEETTLVDEELVLSLTQNSILSSSLDQSLLLALDSLAAQNEVNAAVAQEVEDDSILGSQITPEQDLFGNDISDGELEALNYSLPPDLSPDNHAEDDNVEDSDEDFEENIPQLDGIGDIDDGKKKKSKQGKRKRRVLVENSATDTYLPSDGEEILLNTVKDSNCWPESGKQETLEEVFSDEEPYNSPHFDDRCELVDIQPIINVNDNYFETVLRGDPSFTSGDIASEDVLFQDDASDIGKKTFLSEEPNQTISDLKPLVDKNSNIDALPSLNNSLDMEKTDMLAIGGEELLNTSQLDEILNEDLNKGLEIICEKSPQQEFKENWIRSGANSNRYEIKEGDEDSLAAEVATSADLTMRSYSCESLDPRMDEVIGIVEQNLESFEPFNGFKMEDLDMKPVLHYNFLIENSLQTLGGNFSCDENILPLKDSNRNKTICKSQTNNLKNEVSPNESPSKCQKSPNKSPSKSGKNMLIVKWIHKKEKRKVICNNLFEMSKKEIETYYYQLDSVTKNLSLRTDINEPLPILWFPIRENTMIEPVNQNKKRKSDNGKPNKKKTENTTMKNVKQNKERKLDNVKQNRNKKSKSKTSLLRIMKKCKFSNKEILKMKSCKVRLFKLTNNEIIKLSRKPGNKSNPSSQTGKHSDKSSSKTKLLKKSSKSFESISPLATNLGQNKIPAKGNLEKGKSTYSGSEKPHSFEESLQTNKVSEFHLRIKSPKHSKLNIEKSLPSKKSSFNSLDKESNIPKMDGSCASDTVSEFCTTLNNARSKVSLNKHNRPLQFSVCETKPKKRKPEVNLISSGSKSDAIEKKKNEINTLVNTSIKKDDSLSCENIESSPLKDQTSSFKLDKKCTVTLAPVSVDVHKRQTKENLDLASKTLKSHKKRPHKKVSIPKEKICSPLIKIEKLVIPTCSNDVGEFEKLSNDTASKDQTLSIIEETRPLNKDVTENTSSRKRPLRIYSLDGTADNSSSDENSEDKGSRKRSTETTSHHITPNKRRKSKLCRSPRNYVPLDIEIKKSPKAKPKKSTNDVVSHVVAEGLTAELGNDSSVTDDHPEYSSFKELDSSKCHDKGDSLIKRLPSISDLHSDSCSLSDKSRPKASTSSHPQTKRLQVFVKRLSLDTLGDSLEHRRVLKLKGRTQRSFSLPTSTEEKYNTSYKNVECKSKHHSKVENDIGVEEHNLSVTDKGNKVRKALMFPVKEEGEMRSGSDRLNPTSVLKSKLIPGRKLRTDMFDGNNTPGRLPTPTPDPSENSSDFLPLSGVTRNNLSDLENISMTSDSPINNTFLSLNYSECSPESTNFDQVNRNPHNLLNPTLFTPALAPPSRSEVLAKLRDFGLPEEVNTEPFYSDPADVSKACEVGSTVLKLQSKSVIHLEEFVGSFGSVTKWKKESYQKKYNKDYNSCFKNASYNKSLTITPLKLPPSQLQAKEWLKSKLARKEKEVAETKKHTKIVLPSSPGNIDDDNDEDSMDDSVTISQCTPLSKKSDEECGTGTDQTHTTPEVIVNKLSDISPLMSSTPVGNQLKISASKRRFSRPSSAFRQSLPLIKEENNDNLQEGVNQNEISSQTTSASDSTKLSDSGIKRLLSETKSPNISTSCQIDMATPNNSGNYRMELENLQDVKLIQEHQYLTILSMELHVHTRGELRPNPDHDAICCIFYNITNDYPEPTVPSVTGAIYVSNDEKEEKLPQFKCELQAVPCEMSLIAAFLNLVRTWDPDIFVGYEIELLSWGYLLQRGYVLNMNLVAELSRVRALEWSGGGEAKDIRDDDSEIRLTGRIVLNLWRFLRHEVALQSYTFENIVYHVLHQRVPLFSFRTLTSWWAHRTKLYRWLVFEHYFTRVEGIAKIMRHVDLVGRTSEFARLFGIQFYEVLSRGSQFRVESMMLRLVKPLNYVAVSPSIQQRARMRAPESLPLIMEPESRFYADPVIVLDFQSLYPSIIIAYNYCYSTCLGRVEHLGRSELFEFGCTQLRVPMKELLKLRNSLNFAPCGVAFVNQSVKRGVLPRMLEEILNTRLMVKQSMKENKDNKTLKRVLHNRQLGLKLIANVTYGYTAANFSGRMPCIEVGDSVVSKARETLERAISLVGNNKQWGARVIYGDTDSMFVLVPGKSRQEAFRIGAEIADAVTNDNPQPVKLKLEKVYQPCLLQTKKRYVGYMYESPSQEEPVYDAKGIETVRRDGCPAVAKVLEKSLRLLFETKDVSLVKRYVCRQFSKVLSGRVSIQELTFAREYRGAAGYRPGACVPALELAKQGRAVDPRSEPRVGERVPYVVVAGAPGLPLIRLVRPPTALLHDPGLRINAEYYITRVIAPPLERCFSLLGAQVSAWYAELPRKQLLHLPVQEAPRVGSRKATTISQYFATCECISCGKVTTRGVCDQCQLQPQQLSVTLAAQLLSWERREALVTKVCQSCCGRMYGTDCTSLDCPVLYRLHQARKDLKQADYVRGLQQEFLSF